MMINSWNNKLKKFNRKQNLKTKRNILFPNKSIVIKQKK